MVEKDPASATTNQEIQDIDLAIEKDIRKLKRTSNLLILLGMFSVLILIGALTILFMASVDNFNVTSSYKTYVFVKNDGTVVYSSPEKTSAIVARLTKGETMFLVNEKNGWGKVEKRTISGWVEMTNIASKDEMPPRHLGGDVPIRFIDVTWIVDEIDNFTIIGKIENMSEYPLKDIKIQVNFYDREEICCDEKGNQHLPISSTETWVAREKPLVAGVKKKFIITGKYEKNFKKIRYRIVSYE